MPKYTLIYILNINIHRKLLNCEIHRWLLPRKISSMKCKINYHRHIDCHVELKDYDFCISLIIDIYMLYLNIVRNRKRKEKERKKTIDSEDYPHCNAPYKMCHSYYNTKCNTTQSRIKQKTIKQLLTQTCWHTKPSLTIIDNTKFILQRFGTDNLNKTIPTLTANLIQIRRITQLNLHNPVS